MLFKENKFGSKCNLFTSDLWWKSQLYRLNSHGLGLQLRISPNTAILCTSVSLSVPIHECHWDTPAIPWLLHTQTHTLIRACSRLVTSAAAKSDAWATAHATMGLAEGGLLELGSSSYMLLRSRVCVWASELTITCSALPCSLLCSATQLVILVPCSLWYNSHILHYGHILQVPLLCQHAVFRQSNVFTHVYVWKNTESSLTVARISLSSSHSCFNRLADILRYLVPSLCSGGPSHPSPASPSAHEFGRAARCVRHMGACVNSSPP